MKKLPSAAEVRGMAGAVAYATRTSTIRKGTAVKLPDEIRDALLQFAELLEDTERVNTYLHERHRHPDYEYRTTDGPRKAWDGTPDLSLEGWTKISWERFDYHEEISWMRRKEKPPEAE